MATNKDTEQCCTLPKLEETEKELVNVAEILREYKENEIILYTTMYGNAFFKGFTRDGGIILGCCNAIMKGNLLLDVNGRVKDTQRGECVLFPSFEMRDWSKFFKHGDVVVRATDGAMFVFDCWAKGDFTQMYITDYFYTPSSFGGNELRTKLLTVETKDFQKADEEHRELFFESMDKSYTFAVKCGRITRVEKKPPHFNTYDKVLVRNRKQSWKIDFFSHYVQFGIYNFRTLGGYYEYCIPFDGNEHLVGKEVIDGEK